jgi:hypothetical protein
MNSNQMKKRIEIIFENCLHTHSQGQQEYANDVDDVFANFQRVASRLDMSKEEALLVYLLKHIDGITSYVKGVESQREDISGRIVDAIVYLCLLQGMIDENRKSDSDSSESDRTPVPSFVS